MNNAPLGKKYAVIAYLTFIGMLIAFFMNKEDKHPFVTWHVKNMFGLVVFLFASVALQNYEMGIYVYWITVAFWAYSLLMALFNQQKGIPYISEKFQEWFTFLD